jgi:hypothetical protein
VQKKQLICGELIDQARQSMLLFLLPWESGASPGKQAFVEVNSSLSFCDVTGVTFTCSRLQSPSPLACDLDRTNSSIPFKIKSISGILNTISCCSWALESVPNPRVRAFSHP